LSLTDFQYFPGPVTLFQDFPVLENATVKFQDFPGFPGPVQTLTGGFIEKVELHPPLLDSEIGKGYIANYTLNSEIKSRPLCSCVWSKAHGISDR